MAHHANWRAPTVGAMIVATVIMQPAGTTLAQTVIPTVQTESPGRTFNSNLQLDVWVYTVSPSPEEEQGLGWMHEGSMKKVVGRTPSAKPLEIPPDSVWGVRTMGTGTTAQAVAQEVQNQFIPGLSISVNDADMESLKDLKGLQTLYLRGQPTETGLAYLGNLTALQTLDLACLPVTDTTLAHLTRLCLKTVF